MVINLVQVTASTMNYTRKKSIGFLPENTPRKASRVGAIGVKQSSQTQTLMERRGINAFERTVQQSYGARKQSAMPGGGSARRATALTMGIPSIKKGRILSENRIPDSFNGLYSVRFSPAGVHMACSYGSGGIQIRNPENGELVTTIRSGLDQALPVMCLRFNPLFKDKFYAASTSGVVFGCDAEKGEHFRFAEEKSNEVNSVDASICGELLVSGGKDAAVRVYNAETTKIINKYQRLFLSDDSESNKFHSMRIFSVRFHPRMRDIIISGGWDDTIRVWDVRSPDFGCVRKIHGPHISGDSIDLKDDVVLTGSWVVSGSLQRWDLGSGKLIDTIVPMNRPTTLDGEFLYSATYFDGDPFEDMVIVGGSGTGAVEIISISQKKVLGSFKVKKAVQAIDSYDNFIAYGGMESVVRLGVFS